MTVVRASPGVHRHAPLFTSGLGCMLLGMSHRGGTPA
jgi:hypothetical protein